MILFMGICIGVLFVISIILELALVIVSEKNNKNI